MEWFIIIIIFHQFESLNEFGFESRPLFNGISDLNASSCSHGYKWLVH